VELNWYPANDFDERLQQSQSNEPLPSVTVLGHDASVSVERIDRDAWLDGIGGPPPPPPGRDVYVALWVQNVHAFEARGFFASREPFADVLTALVEVGGDTWLEAMPDSVVRPTDHDTAVEAMLPDIPLPPGFAPTRCCRETTWCEIATRSPPP
jgi:hypothetical protein